MDIQRSLSSAYASATNFASNVGNTVKQYGSRAIEQGRLGVNHTVELIKNNPKAAVATGVAALAIAGVSVYMLSGVAAENSTS